MISTVQNKDEENLQPKVNSQFPQAPFIPLETHIYKLFSKDASCFDNRH